MTDSFSSQPLLFDRSSVRRHRDRAANGDWRTHGFLFEEVADRLAERSLDITRSHDLVLDLGCHEGAFGQALATMGKAQTVVSVDISTGMVGKTPNNLKVVASEEFLPFASESFDLIGSVLSLHWTNDLPGALIQINRALKADGIFLGALFGIETLHELKECLTQAELEIRSGVSPRISPFTEVRDAGALLQRAGFALPVSDVETITLKYKTPFDLLKELRGMGEANALLDRQKSFTGRKVLMRMAEIYFEKYADEQGLIPATFQIIYLTGWSPHESQQVPLKRGSATTSLTEILDQKKPE
ncbi:methyltransferase domain-containing protein [Sneathiella sp.]|jgi:NADH dehydrogenase [ubiquinone] 1 alpha subcomplex assembly factor 5|uniref:methyltransferase domain-containing protein n=1 Tax=Sneathiella sp. TaxID=1964365 RepID=UPI0039E411E8